MTQVAEEWLLNKSVKYVKKINDALKQPHDSSKVYIHILNRKVKSLKHYVYPDLLYTSNDKISSQLGYFIICRMIPGPFNHHTGIIRGQFK